MLFVDGFADTGDSCEAGPKRRGGGSRFLGEKEQAGKVCRKVGNLREKEDEERKRGKRRGRNDGAGVKRNRRIDKRNVGNNWQFARRTFS